jgi:CRISPR/Cas system CMR-associated protein Cmr5 small subunit
MSPLYSKKSMESIKNKFKALENKNQNPCYQTTYMIVITKIWNKLSTSATILMLKWIEEKLL